MNPRVVMTIVVMFAAAGFSVWRWSTPRSEPVAEPDASSESTTMETATLVLDAPSADEVVTTLRQARRVGLAEPATDTKQNASPPRPRWTFETLGPLQGQDAVAFRQKREVYLGVSVKRLAELVEASHTKGEPDLARFAVENEAVAQDRAILEDFERGSYVTVRKTDRAACKFLHALASPTTVVVECNAMRHGELISAFFIFTQAARPEIFEAEANTAETQRYLSDEFCKRFNALPEAKRRELWTAWNKDGPKHPAYPEAQSWFQSKVPLRLALHEPDGLVVVRP